MIKYMYMLRRMLTSLSGCVSSRDRIVVASDKSADLFHRKPTHLNPTSQTHTHSNQMSVPQSAHNKYTGWRLVTVCIRNTQSWHSVQCWTLAMQSACLKRDNFPIVVSRRYYVKKTYSALTRFCITKSLHKYGKKKKISPPVMQSSTQLNEVQGGEMLPVYWLKST